MMTTFLRRALVATAALTMGASLAAAQQGRVVDPRTVPELKAEFDRARKLGLETEPLETQARKGYMMAVSPKTIRESVHNFADAMVRASQALKPARGTAEINAGALALRSDIPVEILRSLRQVEK